MGRGVVRKKVLDILGGISSGGADDSGRWRQHLDLGVYGRRLRRGKHLGHLLHVQLLILLLQDEVRTSPGSSLDLLLSHELSLVHSEKVLHLGGWVRDGCCHRRGTACWQSQAQHGRG